MNIHRTLDVLFRYTRRRRMRWFENTMRPGEGTTVLDVGGTPGNWRFTAAKPNVVLLNIRLPANADNSNPKLRFVRGNALSMPCDDAGFDLVFSNAVIEHLGNYDAQRRFAAECRRAGRRIWVQTPARSFPIEPHYLAPFVHWLPWRIQRRILRWCSPWGLMTRPSGAEVQRNIDEIRLLRYSEMRELFPDCDIIIERFLLLPKSYIAVRR